MYIFIDKDRKEKTSFLTKDQLFDFLDCLCQENGYLNHIDRDLYLRRLDNGENFNIGEIIVNGFCISKNPEDMIGRAYMLGYWARIECSNY